MKRSKKLNHKKVIIEFNKRAVEKTGIIRVLSDRFAHQVNEEFDKKCKFLIRKHFKNKINKVIDVGTGIGRITSQFVKKADNIIAIDFAEKMLFVANKQLANKKNVHFLYEDAVNLLFPTNYFDLGILSLVLKHNNDKRTVVMINKVKKWCKQVLLIEHVAGGSAGSEIAITRSASWYLRQFKPMKPVVIYEMKRYKDNIIFCILQ